MPFLVSWRHSVTALVIGKAVGRLRNEGGDARAVLRFPQFHRQRFSQRVRLSSAANLTKQCICFVRGQSGPQHRKPTGKVPRRAGVGTSSPIGSIEHASQVDKGGANLGEVPYPESKSAREVGKPCSAPTSPAQHGPTLHLVTATLTLGLLRRTALGRAAGPANRGDLRRGDARHFPCAGRTRARHARGTPPAGRPGVLARDAEAVLGTGGSAGPGGRDRGKRAVDAVQPDAPTRSAGALAVGRTVRGGRLGSGWG